MALLRSAMEVKVVRDPWRPASLELKSSRGARREPTLSPASPSSCLDNPSSTVPIDQRPPQQKSAAPGAATQASTAASSTLAFRERLVTGRDSVSGSPPAIGAPWRPRLWADNMGHVLAVDHVVRSEGGGLSERRSTHLSDIWSSERR